jgi:hypothetical protein
MANTSNEYALPLNKPSPSSKDLRKTVTVLASICAKFQLMIRKGNLKLLGDVEVVHGSCLKASK